MQGFRKISVLAVGAALFAVPATASAEPNVKDVRSIVKQANGSLGQASDAALRGDYGDVRSAIAKLGAHAKRSDQLARKIRRLADSQGERVRASKALVAVGAQYDRIVGEFTDLLAEVDAEIQPLIAQGIALGTDAQDRILGMLVKLAGTLPEPVAENALSAIERFQTDGDIEALIAALTSGDVIASVKGMLTEHLDAMFADLQAMVDRLAEIDPRLADMVGGTLGSLRETVDQVNDLLAGLFEDLLGGALPLFPGFGDLPGFGKWGGEGS